VRRRSYALESTLAGKQRRGWWGDWKVAHYHSGAEGKRAIDSINGSFRHEANRFTGYYSVWVDDVRGDHTFRHNVNVGTALAWVDGAFAVGRPINDSFAVVVVPKELGDTPLNVLRSGYVTATATHRLNGLVPGLHAYHPATCVVETGDFEFEPQRFVLYPSYRSGMKLTPGEYDEVFGPLTCTGVLMDRQGEPLALKALVVSNLSAPDAERYFTFTNYDGRFQTSGFNEESVYRFDVVEDATLFYEFTIPDQETVGRMVDLGSLHPVGAQEAEAVEEGPTE
jgi:outer membrane usher protein